MDGPFQAGWYDHPQYGVIKIFENEKEWVYVCYTSSGAKKVSRQKSLDSWTWVASEPNNSIEFSIYED